MEETTQPSTPAKKALQGDIDSDPHPQGTTILPPKAATPQLSNVFINNFTSYSIPLKRLTLQANFLYQQLSLLPAEKLCKNFTTGVSLTHPLETKKLHSKNLQKNDSTNSSDYLLDDYIDNSSERVRIAFVSTKVMQTMPLGEDQHKNHKNEYAQPLKNPKYKNIKKLQCPDVLAWNDFAKEGTPISGCGDIAICLPIILANAKTEGIEKNVYALEIIFHGMWHLFGMRHDYNPDNLKKIEIAQQNYLKKWKVDHV